MRAPEVRLSALKKPRHLRHRLRGSSRSLLVACFAPELFFGFWPKLGQAMTSSTCSSPPNTMSVDLANEISVGRNLQVKDRRFCFARLPTFGGPHVLAFDQ
jgi:hypothetical protein